MRFQTFPINSLAGLNEDENPYSLGNDELTIASNVWRRGRTLGTRPGLVRGDADYDGAITSTPAVQGIVEYVKDNDATRKLVVVAGGEVRTDHDGTPLDKTTNSITISSGAANTWVFAQHKGNLYGAGGAATDKPWKYTGSGALTLLDIKNLSAAALTPKFIFEKWNRLFAARFTITSSGAIATDVSSNPMVVRYSALNDADTWPAGNSFGGTSAIGGLSSYGSEFTTGFGSFTDNEGDWLLVLTNKRLYAVRETGNPLAPFQIGRTGSIANGCVHQLAFVSLGLDAGDAIYLSNQGIHSMRQSQQFGARQEYFLSWKIRETFATLNQSQLHRAVGAFWKEEGVVVFAVPTGSNSFNDTLLVLDVKGQDEITANTARWYKWKLSPDLTADQKAVNALVAARSSGKEWLMYGGNEDGDVFQLSTDTYSDLGKVYDIQLRTKHNDYGAPGLRKGIGDVFWEVQGNGSYSPTVRIVYDFGRRSSPPRTIPIDTSGAVFDTAVFDVDTFADSLVTSRSRIYGVGSGDTIALDISHSGNNQPVWLAQVSPQVRVFGESVGDEA